MPGMYWDEPIETASTSALQALQVERLNEQLSRLHERSPFYRERLGAVGFEPDALQTLEDLSALPIVTKCELRDEQSEHPPFGRFVVADEGSLREVHPSSGTTGSPVNTVWSARDADQIADMTARTMWQFGVRPGDIVQNAFAYGLWVAGMSSHYACSKLGVLVVPTGTGVSTDKQIDYLRRLGSTVLLSTPSYAIHIAEELTKTDFGDLPIRLGCFGGEAGAENPATRQAIEAGLGIDAFDYYGLAEIGPTFASECSAKAGIHFAEDHILVESVDPETKQPVADGELGVLVFTHLTREATPMLRYWSNDYARLTREQCVCGRTHVRAIGGVLGRHDDLIIFKGAKFYPSQVEKVVRTFHDLSPEFQVEIERDADSALVRSCTVVAEWAGRTAGDAAEPLKHALRAELGVTPNVRIEPAGSLARTSFKAVRLVVLEPTR